MSALDFASRSEFKYVLIAFLVIIGLGSIWYTQNLASQLMDIERQNLELWAKAVEFTANESSSELSQRLLDLKAQLQDQKLEESLKRTLIQTIDDVEARMNTEALNFVTSEILYKQRFNIPAIITDAEGNILDSRNAEQDREKLPQLALTWSQDYPPITIALRSPDTVIYQRLYYGDSNIIRALKYFPFVQLGLVGLVFLLAYMSWVNIRRNEQSNVWVGMAKEAAHQLGTPITGLMGWITLLKEQVGNEEQNTVIAELESDVERLRSVADRFNKIGSKPELLHVQADSILKELIHYLEQRMPVLGNTVELKTDVDTTRMYGLNRELFKWALENILKNALDALDPDKKGQLFLQAKDEENALVIWIKDNGRGIPASNRKNIFKPGFSTKKRGWGLGLSLSRRIIEDYHGGKLILEYSEVGKGTSFRIEIPAAG